MRGRGKPRPYHPPDMRSYLILLPLALSCRPKPPVVPPVEGVAEQFYGTQFERPISGAPDSIQLARLRPFITDSLARLLHAARQRHDADLARAPEEKPSWAEGDIFTSLFEGPTAFYVTPAIRDGERAKVPVKFQYHSATDSTTTEWSDTAIVVLEQGRPVVADVIFGGTWAFGQKGSLVGNLQP